MDEKTGSDDNGECLVRSRDVDTATVELSMYWANSFLKWPISTVSSSHRAK